ncbi:hypothetical protein BRPE67_ECDS04430 (plasmid) [Caballeronia cordobensis]|nr:hypothetical protein BRPE67_ECDS04430 [Burkholderia sp. RPE67]
MRLGSEFPDRDDNDPVGFFPDGDTGQIADDYRLEEKRESIAYRTGRLSARHNAVVSRVAL